RRTLRGDPDKQPDPDTDQMSRSFGPNPCQCPARRWQSQSPVDGIVLPTAPPQFQPPPHATAGTPAPRRAVGPAPRRLPRPQPSGRLRFFAAHDSIAPAGPPAVVPRPVIPSSTTVHPTWHGPIARRR